MISHLNNLLKDILPQEIKWYQREGVECKEKIGNKNR